MGMFDTLRLPKTYTCIHCGHQITEIQTSVFGNLLKTYQVGDVAEGSDVKIGVLEESVYCPSCSNIDQKLYITVWHSLISGVYLSQKDAEDNLLKVDRADILFFLMRHQTEIATLRRKYLELFHTVEGYREYSKSITEGKTWDGGFRYLSTALPEVVKDPDPLKRILEMFRPTEAEDSDSGEF